MFVNFYIILFYSRYYHADIIKTRKKVRELISEGEWEADQFKEMKKNLLELLKIQYEFKPID
jgi:hypothetical protein